MAFPLWYPIDAILRGRYGDPRENGGTHKGYDLMAADGVPVYASAAGTVTQKREPEDSRSYGLYIDIDHGAGYVTRYAHLKEFIVPNGAVVGRGQHIGSNGSSGSADVGAEHVHYEIHRHGVALNLNDSGMPGRETPIKAKTAIPVTLPEFPNGGDPVQPLPEGMALTVGDYKHAGVPAGRKRFVRLVPFDGRFVLIPYNGAKIAGHPANPQFGVAVSQASNGAVLGVEPNPDGIRFVVTAADGGTFEYRFEA